MHHAPVIQGYIRKRPLTAGIAAFRAGEQPNSHSGIHAGAATCDRSSKAQQLFLFRTCLESQRRRLDIESLHFRPALLFCPTPMAKMIGNPVQFIFAISCITTCRRGPSKQLVLSAPARGKEFETVTAPSIERWPGYVALFAVPPCPLGCFVENFMSPPMTLPFATNNMGMMAWKLAPKSLSTIDPAQGTFHRG